MTTCDQRSGDASCCDDPADIAWGRLPGAAPPLRWWLPALVFAVAALVLALVVALVVRGPGPRDDPDQARQRDGLLLDGPRLPAVLAGVAFGGRPVVLLFERTPPEGPKYRGWRAAVSEKGALVVVVVAGTPRAAVLADAVGMARPVDGGPPIGYAVIDAARRVRYATLDPAYLKNAFEVDVITGAVS